MYIKVWPAFFYRNIPCCNIAGLITDDNEVLGDINWNLLIDKIGIEHEVEIENLNLLENDFLRSIDYCKYKNCFFTNKNCKFQAQIYCQNLALEGLK